MIEQLYLEMYDMLLTYARCSFREEPLVNNDLPYASLKEALEDDNITMPLVSNWLPDGYRLVDIKIEHIPGKNIYSAINIKEAQERRIMAQDYVEKIPAYVEQSEGLVEEYEVAGIIYFIFADIDLMKAKWINGSYECDIFGNLTIEEIKMMIDSIEKG